MNTKTSSLMGMALFFFILSSFTACKTQQKSAQNEKGWVNLLGSNNLEQWHTFKKQTADPCWYLKDGVLTLDPALSGGGDLVTNKVYKNFVLSLEWKASHEGNSGILINVQEGAQYPKTYLTGPEMQVLDNVAASDNKDETHLAGSLYDMISANPEFVHPAGVWNKVKIKQTDGHIIFWINGHEVVNEQIGSDRWKEMVANSKFKDTESFGAFLEGHIALQDHGHKVWYRNIRIKEL